MRSATNKANAYKHTNTASNTYLKRTIKPAAIIGAALATFGLSVLMQQLDGENDNLSAANLRSVHAEEAQQPKTIIIGCSVADPIPTTSLSNLANPRIVEDIKTVLFPASSVINAALTVADCEECVETIPPPLPHLRCVHSDYESLIDQRDNSCSDDNVADHRFMVTFGRYLTTNDFLE